MKHYASPKFWALYESLPADIRALADKNYDLLKSDSRHPSLHFKKINDVWCVRVGTHYRALATDVEGGVYWFWIGTHAEYDKIVAYAYLVPYVENDQEIFLKSIMPSRKATRDFLSGDK